MNFRISGPFIGFIVFWVVLFVATLSITLAGGFLGFINLAPGGSFMNHLPDYASDVGFCLGGLIAGYISARSAVGGEMGNGLKTGFLIAACFGTLNYFMQQAMGSKNSWRSWSEILQPIVYTWLGACIVKILNRNRLKRSGQMR